MRITCEKGIFNRLDKDSINFGSDRESVAFGKMGKIVLPYPIRFFKLQNYRDEFLGGGVTY